MSDIKKLRNSLGLSQEEFAELLSTTKGQIAMSETGKRVLPTASIVLLYKFELALNKQIQNVPETGPEQNEIENKALEAFIKEQNFWLMRLKMKKEKLQEDLKEVQNIMTTNTELIENPIWEKGSLSADLWQIIVRQAAQKIKKMSLELYKMKLKIDFAEAGLLKSGELK